MTTVRVPQFADPAVKAFLSGVFGAGVLVRSNVPDKWTAASTPLIVVADDAPVAGGAPGSQPRHPVATRRTVRITAFAPGQTAARELVARAFGELLARPVPGLAHVRDGLAPFDAGRDSTHPDAWLASCTVLATVRTRPL